MTAYFSADMSISQDQFVHGDVICVLTLEEILYHFVRQSRVSQLYDLFVDTNADTISIRMPRQPVS